MSGTNRPAPVLWLCRSALTAILLALTFAIASGPVVADDVDTEARVLQMLAEGSENATVGLYLREIDGVVHASHNENFQFEPASSIKTVHHFYAMRQVQDGTVIDGEPVTLATDVPWLAQDGKFDADGEYIPGGSDCPLTNTVPMTSSLQEILELTMRNSDNATTQAILDFFGKANVDATMAALGMTNSSLNHPIGCGGAAIADPNEFTLVDAGKLHEAVATGYLDEPTRATAYQIMLTDGSTFNSIIDDEADGLGLSAEAISNFKAERRSALKGGSYGLNGQSFRSVVGWASLGFKDANCAVDTREYVYGAFIHDSDSPPDVGIRAAGVELFREQIRNGLESWAECEADLEVIDVDFVNPPDEIDVNTPVPVTVSVSVRNNGPASSVDSNVDIQVIAPPTCSADPASQIAPVQNLTSGETVAVERTVDISCPHPSFHSFQVIAEITPQNENVVDPVDDNNSESETLTVGVVAWADVAVVDWDFGELEDAGLGDLLVSEPFVFNAPATYMNFGDTLLGLYHDPVSTDVTRSITVPDGIAGSVHVTHHELNATIVVSVPNEPDQVFPNQPPGTVVEVDGPATISVEYIVSPLAVGEPRTVNQEFNLHCTGPGVYDIEFTNRIVPNDIHVHDPDPSNNTLTVERAVECVTPVQINIRPGNKHNFVNPISNQRLPVAILTTEAGEYDLPVAFDATSIDHQTARFGTLPVLQSGAGSPATPDKSFIRDAHEMDDKTKDGDLDMVLLFGISGSGIDQSTSDACVTGSYVDIDGEVYTFLGCDFVQVQGGGN